MTTERRGAPLRLPAVTAGLLLVLWSAQVHAGDGWTVDAARSRLGFEITETGNPVTGTFSRWSADIRYDPADPGAARLRLHVDTASAATGDTRRDEAMTGADWLDSKRAPVAIFESSGFRPLGGDTFETAGTLRLRDGARPLTLSFKLNLAGDEARAQGSANLDRTQFGVGQGRWSGPAIVGFNVRVTFDLQARRAR